MPKPPLSCHIDPKNLQDLAVILIQALGSVAKHGRWTAGFAGRYGDERVIKHLMTMLRAWAKGSKDETGSHYVRCLAAQGSDEALGAMMGMVETHGAKAKRNLRLMAETGKACFTKAASARGCSLDELSDRIVPTFGLSAHGWTNITFGKRSIGAKRWSTLEMMVTSLTRWPWD